MRNLSLNEMETTEGGKFFGTECGAETNTILYYNDHYEEFCTKDCAYYVFGIKVSSEIITGSCIHQNY